MCYNHFALKQWASFLVNHIQGETDNQLLGL